MDRRQQKTRRAIFQTFMRLLDKKPYHKITIQDIIDEAEIGRSTFYAHFETKEFLIKELCQDLFQHILQSVSDEHHAQHLLNLQECASKSIFCHILQHLKENDKNILKLLSCDDNEIFLRYFKENMNNLLCRQAFQKKTLPSTEIPEDFLINHISSSFVEMIKWWANNKMQPEPIKMDEYFRSVMSGVFEKVKTYKHNHAWIDA